MHAAILYLLDGEPATETLPSDTDGGLPAATADRDDYLDGRTIHSGTLAGHVYEETTVPLVYDGGITTEREERRRETVVDYYADLDTGWAGITSSDGGALLEDYLRSVGVVPQPAVLDLDAFAERLERTDDATVTGSVYSQSIDEGHQRDASRASWHEDAPGVYGLPTEGNRLLAVSYWWDGLRVEAALAASGYVAVYSEWAESTFARWVADEIEPLLSPEEKAQQTLGGDDA
jgi:hypothetical protein